MAENLGHLFFYAPAPGCGFRGFCYDIFYQRKNFFGTLDILHFPIVLQVKGGRR